MKVKKLLSLAACLVMLLGVTLPFTAHAGSEVVINDTGSIYAGETYGVFEGVTLKVFRTGRLIFESGSIFINKGTLLLMPGAYVRNGTSSGINALLGDGNTIVIPPGSDYTAPNLQKQIPTASNFTLGATPSVYNGAPNAASVRADGGMGSITVFYEGVSPTVYAKSASAPTDAGTYSVSIEVAEGENFFAASGIYLGEFTVARTDPSYTVPTGLTSVYGSYLHSVGLPDGFSWDSSYNRGTKVGNAGVNTFRATYTPEDTVNYNVINDIEVEIAVAKAKPVFTVPELTAVYGMTLADVKLPRGFAWCVKSPENVSVGDVGTKYFAADFTPEDTENYENAKVDLPIRVTPATHGYPAVGELSALCGQTLADVALPSASNGKFVWEQADATPVGAVGRRSFTLSFVPRDTNNYVTVTGITAVIEVSKRPAPAAPAAPSVLSRTATGITVTEIVGNEYAIREKGASDYGAWQTSGTFTGLKPSTEYEIITRVAETDSTLAGETSAAAEQSTYGALLWLVIRIFTAAVTLITNIFNAVGIIMVF